jgi:hypothetical protein
MGMRTTGYIQNYPLSRLVNALNEGQTTKRRIGANGRYLKTQYSIKEMIKSFILTGDTKVKGINIELRDDLDREMFSKIKEMLT